MDTRSTDTERDVAVLARMREVKNGHHLNQASGLLQLQNDLAGALLSIDMGVRLIDISAHHASNVACFEEKFWRFFSLGNVGDIALLSFRRLGPKVDTDPCDTCGGYHYAIFGPATSWDRCSLHYLHLTRKRLPLGDFGYYTTSRAVMGGLVPTAWRFQKRGHLVKLQVPAGDRGVAWALLAVEHVYPPQVVTTAAW